MNYLTVPEVAKKLRKRPNTIYDWLRKKDNPLPYINISEHTTNPRGIRIIESELDKWLINEYRPKQRVEKLIEI